MQSYGDGSTKQDVLNHTNHFHPILDFASKSLFVYSPSHIIHSCTQRRRRKISTKHMNGKVPNDNCLDSTDFEQAEVKKRQPSTRIFLFIIIHHEVRLALVMVKSVLVQQMIVIVTDMVMNVHVLLETNLWSKF